MNKDEAERYEHVVLRNLLDSLSLWKHGMLGRATEVRLEGEWPDTQVVIRYEARDGGTFETRIEVWSSEWLASPGVWEPPEGLGGLIVSNWFDGSLPGEPLPN